MNNLFIFIPVFHFWNTEQFYMATIGYIPVLEYCYDFYGIVLHSLYLYNQSKKEQEDKFYGL